MLKPSTFLRTSPSCMTPWAPGRMFCVRRFSVVAGVSPSAHPPPARQRGRHYSGRKDIRNNPPHPTQEHPSNKSTAENEPRFDEARTGGRPQQKEAGVGKQKGWSTSDGEGGGGGGTRLGKSMDSNLASHRTHHASGNGGRTRSQTEMIAKS